MLTRSVKAEGIVIEEAIPLNALRMIIGMVSLTNPAHSEMTPRPDTPPMNAIFGLYTSLIRPLISRKDAKVNWNALITQID